MSRQILGLAVAAIVLAACGGTATGTPGGTTPPGETQAPGETATPAETQDGGETTPPNAGDIEAKARALVPPGSTELGTGSFGGAFQITVTNPMSVAELEAFWDQKIPSLGMTVSGKFTAAGTLTIAITNPDGGIVAGEDSSGSGETTIVISLGTSS